MIHKEGSKKLSMNIDSIVYQNIRHLLDKYGISERNCTLCCRLNPNFFSNYRKGVTKHFRICDIIELARFFDVSVDYLCKYGNTRDEFFVPHHKLLIRDEKILMNAFKKLDPVSRIAVTDVLAEETKNTRLRRKQ